MFIKNGRIDLIISLWVIYHHFRDYERTKLSINRLKGFFDSFTVRKMNGFTNITQRMLTSVVVKKDAIFLQFKTFKILLFLSWIALKIRTKTYLLLEAIRTGLHEVRNPDLPVKVYTYSSYAYGLLALGWKAKKNTELTASILNLMKRFKNLQLIKVKGHAGIDGNEKADRLATSAAQKS